jgi:hypothetical protein
VLTAASFNDLVNRMVAAQQIAPLTGHLLTSSLEHDA